MPKICYVDKNFSSERLDLIEQINNIVDAYHNMGYDLTLRQVYYQLVAAMNGLTRTSVILSMTRDWRDL